MDEHYKVVKGYRVKKKKSTMERRLTEQEVQLLLDSITPEIHKSYYKRNRAMVLLLLNTGLRVGELSGMKVHDVMLMNGSIKTLLDVRPEIAKRKKARQIPLNDIARQAVSDLLGDRGNLTYTDPLVTKPDGKPLSKRAMQDVVTGAALKAGLNRLVGCHMLRHTCLSKLYERTKNVKVVQTIAGHSSSKITLDMYTHATLDGLTEAMKTLEGDDKAS